MSKHLELWKKQTGQENFDQLTNSILGESDENKKNDNLLKAATAIYRNYQLQPAKAGGLKKRLQSRLRVLKL